MVANSVITELTLPSSAKTVTWKDLYSVVPMMEFEFPRSRLTEIGVPEGQYLYSQMSNTLTTRSVSVSSRSSQSIFWRLSAFIQVR